MWTVYITRHTNSKTIYIGVTSNLKKRLSQHNSNKNSSTVRKSGKWFLAYAEAYRCKEEAYTREVKLKQRGRSKQELIKRIEKSLDI